MKNFVILLFALSSILGNVHAQLIWVNEFHYDNIGADAGEFIEIAVPSSFSDLSTVTLTLYNGSDNASYGTHKLDTFTLGLSSGSYSLYSKSISNIQNGAPDGFSLDQSGTVLQFLSYEGTFQATGGAASGLTSTDIGIAESNSSTVSGSSLGLIGTGSTYAQFVWASLATDSPGALNSGQAFASTPEPHEYALITGLGLLAFAAFRRRLQR
jgi:hypothetical protein